MTSIRKLAFVVFSVSAFIYLVLQTAHGQHWLNKTKASLSTKAMSAESMSTETLIAERMTAERIKNEGLLKDTFAQMLNGSEQAKQLMLLQRQVEETQKQYSELTALLHSLQAQSDDSQDTQTHSAETQNILAQETANEMQTSTSHSEQHSTNIVVVPDAVASMSRGNISSIAAPLQKSQQTQTDAKQRLLAQQARLQEVVQRMEMTALQAISR